jgi:hypothetical protein
MKEEAVMKSMTSVGRSAKSSLLLSLVFAAGLHGAQPRSALAAPKTSDFTIVRPTGNFPTDVEIVQAAADAGGTVVLKATDAQGAPRAFNFGLPQPGGGSVIIRRAVTILGESVGNHVTTIRGGYFPLRGIFATGRIVVRGIFFDGPGGNGFNFIFSDSAEFSSNVITGVVGDVLPNGTSEGIGVFGFMYSGEFVIADNVIDGFDADSADGILLIDGAEASILRNEIHGSHSGGIAIFFPSALVTIEDNLVVTGPGDPSFLGGNGISGVGSLPGGNFHITGNRVEAENPLADGIAVFGEGSQPIVGAVIEKNEVLMHDSLFGAISLYDSVSDTYVGQNRAEGTGAFALQASTFGPLQSSNTFIGNNIARFESDIADVFLDFDTEDTVLVGFSGTVIDLGTNNSVTGFTKLGPGAHLGQQISAAQAQRRELIKTMESPLSRRAIEP